MLIEGYEFLRNELSPTIPRLKDDSTFESEAKWKAATLSPEEFASFSNPLSLAEKFFASLRRSYASHIQVLGRVIGSKRPELFLLMWVYLETAVAGSIRESLFLPKVAILEKRNLGCRQS